MERIKSLWLIGLVFSLIFCASCGEYEPANETEQADLPDIIAAEEAVAIAEANGIDLEAMTYVDMVPYDGEGDNDFVLVWGITEILPDGTVWETYIDPYDGVVLASEPPHPGLLARLAELGKDRLTGDGSIMRGSAPDTYESFPWGWQLPFESSSGAMTNGYNRYTHKGSIYYSTDWDPGNCGHAVYAPSSGWVMNNSSLSGWGYQLVVSGKCAASSCANGGYGYRYLWRLAHFQEVSTVRPGWWISKGYYVGKMGNTGTSTGCHIHFTAYRGTYTSNGNISGSSLPINHWPGTNDSLCNGSLNGYDFWDASYDYAATGSEGCP